MYREYSSSSSSIESFECSYLAPTESVDKKNTYFDLFDVGYFLFFFQLRKAVVDHVSDTFVATSVPLTALIDAARRGNVQLVEETAHIFMEHAIKLIEVC